MVAEISGYTRTLVVEEIERIVEETAKEGRRLRLAASVERVLKAYPESGFSESGLKAEFMIAAALACVPIDAERGERGRDSAPEPDAR